MEYNEIIAHMKQHKFEYKLPTKESITEHLFKHVLCLGQLYIETYKKDFYTTQMFPIILKRLNSGTKSGEHYIVAIKLIKKYYDFKILYDSDHSRLTYVFGLIKAKKTFLKDVILIVNHYYPRNKSELSLLNDVDYIIDYSPKFLLRKK